MTRLNLLGSRCAGRPHEIVPVNVVGIQKIDFQHGRFGNKVQDVSARSAQANNRNPLTADSILNRTYRRPCLESVGYLERTWHRERSGFGVAGRRHGPDDLLRIAVDQVARRPIVLRAALATFLDGDVRPGFSVAVYVALNRVPIRVVHAPVVLFVSGDPHGMDCTAYPVTRFPACRVVRLLNGASAYNPTCKKTRYPDGPDNVGFDPDGKPGLLTERGEAVLTRHARGRPRNSCRPSL